MKNNSKLGADAINKSSRLELPTLDRNTNRVQQSGVEEHKEPEIDLENIKIDGVDPRDRIPRKATDQFDEKEMEVVVEFEQTSEKSIPMERSPNKNIITHSRNGSQ